MAHVLIGFAEALPAPEVVFSLIRAGHRVSAFCCTGELPLRHLPLAALHRITAPEQNAEAAAEDLKRLMCGGLASSDRPNFVLPLDDPGLWLSEAAGLEANSIAGATGGQVELALNKELQISFAGAAGFHVPQTQVVSAGAAINPDVCYPAIAKPAHAVRVLDDRLTKSGAVYLTDRESANLFVGGLRPEEGSWLLQPLITGQGEGMFGFASETGVSAWSAHRRLRMMNPHGSGASACCSQTPDPELCQKGATFIESIGWKGAFMLEFLRDENATPWFMELNGRMWGSMALARRQGLEYPAWSVAQAENPNFCPPQIKEHSDNLIVRHLGREILHLLFVMRGPKSDFHRANWPHFSRSLVAVMRPGRGPSFYNYDPSFPRYYLNDAFWTVKKALFR